ncbi:hypothetical protein GW932_03900 [archaeon]|nr:hypothetical protein [archaeon]
MQYKIEDDYIEIELKNSEFSSGGLTIPSQEFKQDGLDYQKWGEKNNYPDELLRLKRESSMHGSILASKSSQVAGYGFTFDDTTPKGKRTAKFLREINSKGQDINELLNPVSDDITTFNAITLSCTFSKDWSKITEVEHIDLSKIRIDKRLDDMGRIMGHWYAWEWDQNKSYRPKNRIWINDFDYINSINKKEQYKQALDRFTNENSHFNSLSDIEKNILKEGERTAILYFKPYQSGCFFYPTPDYSGAITSIESDIESDIYALSAIQNQFDAGYILKVIGKGWSPEKKRNWVKNFYNNHTNTKKAKKPLIMFSDDKDSNDIVIEKLDVSDLNKTYVAINDNVQSKILTAHRLTNPMLAGVQVAGKLGGGNELQDSYKIWYNTVINPYQLMVTKAFNKIMKYNDMETLSIVESNPFTVEGNSNIAEGQESGNNNEIKEVETNE